MAFLLARLSRHGQWRFRHALRVADTTGRIDPTDNGLVSLDHVSAAELIVTRRPPYPGYPRRPPDLLASASLAAGTLALISPGHVEALFLDGWAAQAEPGHYDVRLSVTVGPETAVILDAPIALL